MIKVENIDVWGIRHAIRGLRNPLNSWEKSDSVLKPVQIFDVGSHFDDIRLEFVVGEHDLALMRKLYRAGSEHRKYLRQIFVSMDIVAPLYWWKEFDTYKIGTVANSCSTMHRLMSKPFEMSDFSFEKADKLFVGDNYLESLLEILNDHRNVYLNYNDSEYSFLLNKGITKKDIFDSLIQILPSSYNQRRTITMNYENVFNIIHQREHHKLDEWKEFVKVLKEKLPYVKEIGGFENE